MVPMTLGFPRFRAEMDSGNSQEAVKNFRKWMTTPGGSFRQTNLWIRAQRTEARILKGKIQGPQNSRGYPG